MQIATLGDAHTHSVKLWLSCAYGTREGLKSIRECLYRYELDVETMLCTHGRDFPISMLATRLKCQRCGSRKVTLMMDFPSNTNQRAAKIGR